MKRPTKILCAVAVGVALVALYVGGYFLLVRPAGPYTKSGVIYSRSPVVQGGKVVLMVETCPDYRGVPEKLFRPMHYLDSHYLRPNLWFAISSEAPPRWEDKSE